MSANVRISNLPNTLAAAIVDTDILAIVTGIAGGVGVTSKVAVSELRIKLGTTAPGGGRTVTSASTYLSNNAVFNVKDFGAIGDDAIDDTAAIQLAITQITSAGRGTLHFPVGQYKILDELVLPSNCYATAGAGVRIRQGTANKHIFKVTSKDNVWLFLSGAILYGEGSWSAAWSDFATHNDRGVGFYGCTNCGLVQPRIRNMAMASIVVLGGSNNYIEQPIIEGTHALGHALTTGVSIYQFGIIVMHDVTFGAYQNIHINHPTIFNVAMGINSVENIPNSHGLLTITSPTISSFIAQHGLYLGTSNTTVTNPTIDGTGLDGIKVYSGVGNEILRNVVITDFNISGCIAGQAVELGVSGTGQILGCKISGTAYNCARALVMDGDVRGAQAKIVSDTMSQYALYIAGATGPTDCDIEVVSRITTLHSIVVASATSARNRIRAKLYRPGNGQFAIDVNTCASLTIESPEVFDDLSNMAYGVYLDVGAANVRFTGTPKIFGYVNNGISANNVTAGQQAQWHASGAEFTSLATAFANQGNNIEPVTPLRLGRQTTVNSNVPLWQLTLDDESAYHVAVKLVGKLAGSAERKTVELRATYWRDAAGVATLQGTVTTLHTQASAGFAGTFDLATPTVNDVRLLVNSTAAVTYDWRAEVQVTKMSP